MEGGNQPPSFPIQRAVPPHFCLLFLQHRPWHFLALKAHFQNTRLPHATYHSGCTFISNLLFQALYFAVLCLQNKQPSQASRHFGYRSAGSLPYYALSSLVISHQNKHTTQAFSFNGILSFYTTSTLFISYRIGATIGLVPNPAATLTDGSPCLPSWDDWVPQDRIRKMNEDNKALAANLKFEMDKLLRPKAVAASNKKKAAGSDLSSNRGSEERNATPITGRGQKRGRDYEIEKVREKLPSKRGGPSSSSNGSKGKSLAPADQESELRRSKRLKANPLRGAKELLASSFQSTSPSKLGDVSSSFHGSGARPPTLKYEKSELRRSNRLRANPARGAKELLVTSSESTSPTISHPKLGPSEPKCGRSEVPKPLPTSAARYETDDSRVQLVTPAEMRRSWTASVHHTASSCFDWAGLRSDIPYEKLDVAERKAGFPPRGFRFPYKNGKPRPPLPRRRLPPIRLHEGFPPEKIHFYCTMRRLIGLVDDIPRPRSPPPHVKAGITLEDNIPEDFVDCVEEQRAHLIVKSNGQVQFTNRANGF